MKIQNIYDNPIFYKNYEKLRNNDLGFNKCIEQPAIIELVDDFEDKTILDIGCGFGEFARYALEKGASSILGIDPSHNMLSKAKELTADNRINYQKIAIENFESEDNVYDIIVSSLVFHYVENLSPIITKIKHWLKATGILIFSVEHPICTAHPEAILYTDNQERKYHPIYNYRDEIRFNQTWFVKNVQKYHRTISTYVNLLFENDLFISKILEPMPTDEMIKERENFLIHKIRPPLLIIKAKPSF